MHFSMIALAVGLGFANTAIALPQISSLSQIADGQLQNPAGTSRSTSGSNTGFLSRSSTSSSNESNTSDSEVDEGTSPASLSSYYISPQGNANAMMVNQIPDGQAQALRSTSTGSNVGASGASPLSLAGSESLNTYSYETGQGNIFGNSAPVSQIPDGQVQTPGTYSILSSPSEELGTTSIQSTSARTPVQQILDGQPQVQQIPDGQPQVLSSGAEIYASPDYEAYAEMLGLTSSSLSNPVRQISDGQVQSFPSPNGSYSSSSTNSYGQGVPEELADTTYAIGAVPNGYTASGVPEVETLAVPGGEAEVGVQSIPSLYEGSAMRNNVAIAGIVVALVAAFLG